MITKKFIFLEKSKISLGSRKQSLQNSGSFDDNAFLSAQTSKQIGLVATGDDGTEVKSSLNGNVANSGNINSATVEKRSKDYVTSA